MRTRPKFDWDKALAEQRALRAAEAPKAPLTPEERSKLREEQAFNRIRSARRLGPRSW